ncbi:MAG: PAS domain S-box protein [Phycisphaerales bacterium]|nr:PAS domain S-box protein [Phycisphaerales bacterium]
MARSSHVEDRSARELEMLKLRVADLEARLRESEAGEQRLRDTEQLLREVLTVAQGGVVVYDLDLRYVYWNRYMEEVTGVCAEDALGRTPVEVFPHLVNYDIESVYRRALAGETVRSPDVYTAASPDGRRLWTVGTYTPRRDANGRIIGIVGTVHDITERKEVEEALRRSKVMLAEAQSIARLGSWEWDLVTGELNWSDELFRLYGLAPSKDAPLLSVLRELAHPDDRDVLERAIAEAQSGTFESVDYRIVLPDRSIRHVHAMGKIVHDSAGRPVRAHGIIHDISERKRADAAMAAHLCFLESMERIDQAIRGTVDLEEMMSAVLEETLKIFGCDRAWLLYPCNPQAATWQVPMERTVPEYPGAFALGQELPLNEETAELMRRVLAGDGPVHFGSGAPNPVPPGAGAQFSIRSVLAMPVFPKVGEPWVFGLHACARDRTWTGEEERLLREIGRRIGDGLTTLLQHRNLRSSEERFHALVEHAADAFFLISSDGRVLDVNQRACTSLGYTRDELLGMAVGEIDETLSGPESMQQGWQDTLANPQRTVEGIHRRKDGSTFPVEVKVGLLELNGRQVVLGLARDISARKAAEEERDLLETQLRHAQKMQAVGQLAGGVAHDFNNILTAILGNLEMSLPKLEAALPADNLALGGLRQVERAAQRAAGLTRQLLIFSRRDVAKPEVLDLNAILRDMDKMLRRLISESIELVTIPQEALHRVRADAGQIEQVVMNLVVNARDAMPKGGRLTLEVANVTLDKAYSARHAEASAGPHVMLAVSDTGCGMDAETRERIFEPFFTTKDVGQGTGLGLATVYAIIRRAGGHVQVYSEPARGSTFRVYLPAVDAEVSAPAGAAGDDAPGGDETVLVCEDDASVRKLTMHILQGAGYTVLTAENGADALDLADNHDGPIELLVTDVIMPYMNGKELADELQLKRPEVRTLYVSGYTSNVIAHHGVLDADVAFLEKPYNRQSLLTAARAVLDRQSARR